MIPLLALTIGSLVGLSFFAAAVLVTGRNARRAQTAAVVAEDTAEDARAERYHSSRAWGR